MLFRVELIICQGPASVAFSKRHVLAPRVVAFNSAVRDRVAPERERVPCTVAEEVEVYQPCRSTSAGGGFLGLTSIKANDAICRRAFFFLKRR